MRKEYDFSEGIRGKFVDRAAGGMRVVTRKGTIKVDLPAIAGKKPRKAK